jgi:hypothetical protein
MEDDGRRGLRLSNAEAPAVRGQHTQTGATLVERLDGAISRLATVARQVADSQSKLELAIRTRKVGPIPACAHTDGHEINLRPREALAVETLRECPCCGARLWISVPSVGMLLDAAALEDDTGASDLEILLTRRERQMLNVLRSSRYPLRAGQLAAFIWSDPHRTHDVRSALYRLRTKLRGSSWAIPFPEKGGGIRLVRLGNETRQTTPKLIDDQVDISRVSPVSVAA